MSSRYDVHLMYRSSAIIDPAELNAVLAGYHASLSPSFHMHCIQEGFWGRLRFYKFSKLLAAGAGDVPTILVSRTMDHARKALAFRDNKRMQNPPKVLLELHETAIPHMVYQEDGRPFRAFVSHRSEERVFSRVDGIICTVGSQLQVLDNKFPGHAPAIVLPNNVPAQPFGGCNRGDDLTEGKRKDCFRLRYAGQFTAWKNTGIMFDALSRLPDNYILELAGGKMGAAHETSEMVEKLSEKYGVSGRVTYFGFLPPVEVPLFLRQADCLLLPLGESVQARLFTSPMKLFEYAASGKPMIVTRQPTTMSLIEDNVHALMVRPGVADDIARAVVSLAEDVSLGKKIACNALNWVKQYSAENRASEYHLFLDKLIGR